MQRRELLGLLSVGVAGLAGCGGSSSDEEPPTLSGPSPSDVDSPVYPFNAGAASEFEFEESPNGTALIRVPVTNTRNETYAGELRLRVDYDGEEHTVTRDIQLAGGETRKFPVEIDTNWSSWTPNFAGTEFSEGTPVDDE